MTRQLLTALSTTPSTRASRSGLGMGPIVPGRAYLRLSCEPSAASPRGSTFVFETDLDLDPVLDDLAVLDDRARLHDFDRLDVADGLRGGGNCLASCIAPRLGTRSDHFPNDDHAHRSTSCFDPSRSQSRATRNQRADPGR